MVIERGLPAWCEIPFQWHPCGGPYKSSTKREVTRFSGSPRTIRDNPEPSTLCGLSFEAWACKEVYMWVTQRTFQSSGERQLSRTSWCQGTAVIPQHGVQGTKHMKLPGRKCSHTTSFEKKNGTKEESKQGHTHQVCHLNHKINTSDKTLDLTIWSKNGPPKVSYQFKTLSLKLSYLLMLAITECRDWAVLLKKQPSGELKPVPQGRISRSKKNMECCHVQIKKKGFGSYEGPASYSTWIHSSFFFFFSVFRPETMSITTNF